jgi:hypothetical protein
MTYEELFKRYYARDCGINGEEIYPAIEIRPIKMQSGNWKMKKEKTHKLMHRLIFPKDKKSVYPGFEQGPIRPPSEVYSFLIRVTRNCPWNRCTFCMVYKKARFLLRPVEHVKNDIDMIHKYITLTREMVGNSNHFPRSAIADAAEKNEPGELEAFQAAVHWIMGSMRSIFIQDGKKRRQSPSVPGEAGAIHWVQVPHRQSLASSPLLKPQQWRNVWRLYCPLFLTQPLFKIKNPSIFPFRA